MLSGNSHLTAINLLLQMYPSASPPFSYQYGRLSTLYTITPYEYYTKQTFCFQQCNKILVKRKWSNVFGFTLCLHTQVSTPESSFLWGFLGLGFCSSPISCINNKSLRHMSRAFIIYVEVHIFKVYVSSLAKIPTLPSGAYTYFSIF